MALELPAPVVAALHGWAERVEDPALRVLRAEALHVTLAFLGERPADEVDDIAAAVTACAAPVPGLCLAEPAWLGRGGVLAIDLDDPEGACGGLAQSVSDALVALGAYTPEERAFRPHVTVARVRRGARPRRSPLPELPDLPRFAGQSLTLFRSRLSRAGATYEPLAQVALAF